MVVAVKSAFTQVVTALGVPQDEDDPEPLGAPPAAGRPSWADASPNASGAQMAKAS
jgi:hypothetical protein